MRIGIVGDSHGNLYSLDRAISLMGDIDFIIHLGDNYKDIIKINEKYKKPIEYVAGNNDFAMNSVYEKVIELEGRRILMTHGHKYSVYYGLDRLYYRALEEKADIVLYGHTHIQTVEKDSGILFLNPGSTSRPRDTKPGCIVLTIEKNKEIDVNPIRFTV